MRYFVTILLFIISVPLLLWADKHEGYYEWIFVPADPLQTGQEKQAIERRDAGQPYQKFTSILAQPGLSGRISIVVRGTQAGRNFEERWPVKCEHVAVRNRSRSIVRWSGWWGWSQDSDAVDVVLPGGDVLTVEFPNVCAVQHEMPLADLPEVNVINAVVGRRLVPDKREVIFRERVSPVSWRDDFCEPKYLETPVSGAAWERLKENTGIESLEVLVRPGAVNEEPTQNTLTHANPKNSRFVTPLGFVSVGVRPLSAEQWRACPIEVKGLAQATDWAERDVSKDPSFHYAYPSCKSNAGCGAQLACDWSYSWRQEFRQISLGKAYDAVPPLLYTQSDGNCALSWTRPGSTELNQNGFPAPGVGRQSGWIYEYVRHGDFGRITPPTKPCKQITVELPTGTYDLEDLRKATRIWEPSTDRLYLVEVIARTVWIPRKVCSPEPPGPSSRNSTG